MVPVCLIGKHGLRGRGTCEHTVCRSPMANVPSTQDVRSEGRGARWGLPCAQRTAGISSTLASNLGDKQYSVASAWQVEGIKYMLIEFN